MNLLRKLSFSLVFVLAALSLIALYLSAVKGRAV